MGDVMPIRPSILYDRRFDLPTIELLLLLGDFSLACLARERVNGPSLWISSNEDDSEWLPKF
jgi:hypothetical protein